MTAALQRQSLLRSVKRLSGKPIVAQDGAIGFVVEVYFDDEHWQLRHIVIDTGHPMPQREVLIARDSIAPAQPGDDVIHVRLTRAQVERAPDPDADPPVWRQFDLRRAGHYRMASLGDPHLRSSAIVIGYAIMALDGAIGHVEDLLLDGGTWAIADIVADTRTWLPGKRVMLPPRAVQRIDRASRRMYLGLTRSAIRSAPPA
jgi:hypothetical protein